MTKLIAGAAAFAMLVPVLAKAITPGPGIGASLSAFSSDADADPAAGTTVSSGVISAAGAFGADPLSPQRVASSLSALRPDSAGSTRGAREVAIYKQLSPSVVLVVTSSGIGSGALISADGRIITNYHVVGDEKAVGVIFKPAQEGAQITKADLIRAQVLKIDQVSDLALIKVAATPPTAQPLGFGNLAGVMVGADVHAIGHPTGEAWTYTRGIVSQIRRNYEWTTESNLAHTATVIQTQTPINPGNSGGPLLDNDGRLIGVNSFKSAGEGLNFAVSVEDVQRFLNQSSSRYAAAARPTNKAEASAECEPRVGKTKRIQDPPGQSAQMDADCDGTFESIVIVPDDESKAIRMLMDADGDGDIDYAAFDYDRDGNIDESLYDTDNNGKPDLIGYHKDGNAEPYRYEKTS
jgi:S1-C subfamily serine protease